MIENIEEDGMSNNPHYISDALYIAGIATVSRITLVSYSEWSPFLQDYLEYIRAYIDIHEWHDTEAAYSMIAQLNTNTSVRCGTPFVHCVGAYESIWSVMKNDDVLITYDAIHKHRTTIFYLVGDNDGFYGDSEPNISYRKASDVPVPVVGALDGLTYGEMKYEFGELLIV
jgi:hypothetical protein